MWKQIEQQIPADQSNRVVDNAIDLPWRNFPSPEFGAKFQRVVPVFTEVSQFLCKTLYRIGENSPHAKNHLDSSSRFEKNASMRRTDRRTDGQAHDDSISAYCASIASRGKNIIQCSNTTQYNSCTNVCKASSYLLPSSFNANRYTKLRRK